MTRDALTSGDLWVFAAFLAVFGVADAGVLTWQWYAPAQAAWCDFGSYFSCSRVRESAFAAIGSLPVATVGLAGFVALFGIATVRLAGAERVGPFRTSTVVVALAGAGAVIGARLTVVEVFVIESICVLCVIGFAFDLGILGLAWRLSRAPLL